MLHSAQKRMVQFTTLRALLQRLAILDADKRTRDDDEAREQDPGAERREKVVGAGNGVESEEHIDVAGLGRGLGFDLRSLWGVGGVGRFWWGLGRYIWGFDI